MRGWLKRPTRRREGAKESIAPFVSHKRLLPRLTSLLLLSLLLTACASSPLASGPNRVATPALPTAAVRLRTPSPAPSPTLAATPTATPAPQPWRFVVLGDTRTEGLEPPDTTHALVALAALAQPEVVLADGDMINALNTQDEVREQWRRWRAAVAPLGATHLLVTPGNHDVQANAWATDLLVEAFPELPSNGPPGFGRRAYSLDYQGVRFISIDSESFDDIHRLGDAQLDWLEQQLRDNPNSLHGGLQPRPGLPDRAAYRLLARCLPAGARPALAAAARPPGHRLYRRARAPLQPAGDRGRGADHRRH